MGLTNGLLGVVNTVFGSKATAGFTAEAMNRARLGENAVVFSQAMGAKGIINQAINADRIGTDFKEVASAISTAINKGDIGGTYKINGQDMRLGDAINTLIWNGIDTNGADKAFADSISKFKESGMGAMYHAFRQGEISAEEAIGRKAGEGLGIKGALNGFFKDPEYGTSRAKVAIGAGVAGAIGARYLSGGDLTHNARGEKDIAGIPFI